MKRNKGKALIVDDQKQWTDSLCRILSLSGFTVDVEVSIARGAILAQNGTYDIVLMDLYPSEEEGLRALRQISEQGKGNRPRVIVISAVPSWQVGQMALMFGADDYLSKSTADENIIMSIEGLMDLHPLPNVNC